MIKCAYTLQSAVDERDNPLVWGHVTTLEAIDGLQNTSSFVCDRNQHFHSWVDLTNFSRGNKI